MADFSAQGATALSNVQYPGPIGENNHLNNTITTHQETRSYLKQMEYPCDSQRFTQKRPASIESTTPIKKQKIETLVNKPLYQLTNKEFIWVVESQNHRRTNKCIHLIDELLLKSRSPSLELPSYTRKELMCKLESSISEPIKEDEATMVDLFGALISINVNKLKTKNPDEICNFQEIFDFLKPEPSKIISWYLSNKRSLNSQYNIRDSLPAILFSYFYLNRTIKELGETYSKSFPKLRTIIRGVKKIKLYQFNLIITYLDLSGENLTKIIKQNSNRLSAKHQRGDMIASLESLQNRRIKLFTDIHTSDDNKMLIELGKREIDSLNLEASTEKYTWCDLSKVVVIIPNQKYIKEQESTSTADVNITSKNISNNLNQLDTEDKEEKIYFLDYLTSVINDKEEYFTCKINTDNFHQDVMLYLTEINIAAVTDMDLNIIDQLTLIAEYLTLDIIEYIFKITQ